MIDVDRELQWISTLGGPLILMGRTSVDSWSGDQIPDHFGASDYDRAAEIPGYAGILDVVGRNALVLPMPDQTTCLDVSHGSYLLVRWIGANDEAGVLDALSRLDLDQEWGDPQLRLVVEANEVTLFDSVFAGNEIDECLNFRVEPGSYQVFIREYRPSPDIDLLLILLKLAVVA